MWPSSTYKIVNDNIPISEREAVRIFRGGHRVPERRVKATGARAPYHHGNLRAALLGLAIEQIERDGIETLSLRSLARELGVSHAAPSRHFRTRADLLAAIALDGAERLVAAASSALSPAPEADHGADDPVVRLRAFADAFLGWVSSNPAHHRVMRHPEVVRHADTELVGLLRDFATRLEGAVSAAQANGWKTGVPAGSVVFQLIATLEGTASILSDPLYGMIDARLPTTDVAEHTLERLLSDR